MMFTAKDMWESMIVDQDCKGIDDWLKSKVPELRQSKGTVFNVAHSALKYAHWTAYDFIYSLTKRGFSVEEYTDYFRVTFPPQER